MSNPADLPQTIDLLAYENHLSGHEGQYYLRCYTHGQPYTQEDIAQEIARRLHINPAEALMIINERDRVVCNLLTGGHTINTPLHKARLRVKSQIDQADLPGPVDRSKVNVTASFTMGQMLRQAIDRCRLRYFYELPLKGGPTPAGARITTSGALEITGRGLKVAGQDPQNGVTLTNQADPRQTLHIPAARLIINQPKTLLLHTREPLPAGTTWTVAVTTQYTDRSNRLVPQPRTGTLTQPLEIPQ